MKGSWTALAMVVVVACLVLLGWAAASALRPHRPPPSMPVHPTPAAAPHCIVSLPPGLMAPPSSVPPADITYCLTPLGQDAVDVRWKPAVNGWVPVSGVPAGTYTVHVRKPGYADGSRDIRLPLPEGAVPVVELGQMTSGPPGVIAGKIVLRDETTPAAQAQYAVTAVGASPQESDWQSAAGGTFTARNLSAGPHTVHARMTGHAPTRRDVKVPLPAPGTITLVLGKPATTLRWSVVTEQGAARSDPTFEARLTWVGADGKSGGPRAFRADGSGALVLDLPPGAERYKVTCPAPYPAVSFHASRVMEYERYTLRPIGCYQAKGTVVTPDGKADLFGFQVRAVSAETGKELNCTERDGGSNTFTVHDVPAGQLRLVATAEGYGPSDPLTVACDGKADMTLPPLKLTAGARLRVVVEAEGQLVRKGVSVSAYSEHAARSQGGRNYASSNSSGPSANGAFPLTGLAPGKWTIDVRCEHHTQGSLRGVVVEPSTDKTVKVQVQRLRTLEVRVLSPSGKPVRSKSVELSWTCPEGYFGPGPRPGEFRTDATGTVRAEDAGPAIRSVSVACWEGCFTGAPTKPAVNNVVRLDARLQPLGSVKGTVELAGTKWPRGGRGTCLVLTRGAPPTYEPLAEGWDELGASAEPPKAPGDRRLIFEPDRPQFTFDRVPAGQRGWMVYFFGADLVANPVPVAVQSGKPTSVKLFAGAPASLEVRLTGAPARALETARVSAKLEEVESWQMSPRFRPLRGGILEATGLGPGKWQVMAYASSGDTTYTGWTPAETRPGTRTKVTVKLQVAKRVQVIENGRPVSGR